MAKIKIDIKKLDSAAHKLRSIAHPMRVEIISMLSEKKSMNVTQIYTKLKIEQASASHHLGILKTKGVLESERVGKETYYSLNPANLKIVMECVDKCGH